MSPTVTAVLRTHRLVLSPPLLIIRRGTPGESRVWRTTPGIRECGTKLGERRVRSARFGGEEVDWDVIPRDPADRLARGRR